MENYDSNKSYEIAVKETFASYISYKHSALGLVHFFNGRFVKAVISELEEAYFLARTAYSTTSDLLAAMNQELAAIEITQPRERDTARYAVKATATPQSATNQKLAKSGKMSLLFTNGEYTISLN